MANAREFGAKGDGITDDTLALQRAIDETGVLELGKGSYLVSAPLLLDTTQRGYVGVRGAQGTSRIVMTGPGPALRIIGDHQGTANPASFQEHTWERTVPGSAGLRFSTPPRSRRRRTGPYRAVHDPERPDTRMPLRHPSLDRNRNPIIANSHIYRCLDSDLFDAVNLHQAIIVGNHISYCPRGIRQLNGDVHNIQITGNDIEYNSGYADGQRRACPRSADDGLIANTPRGQYASGHARCRRGQIIMTAAPCPTIPRSAS